MDIECSKPIVFLLSRRRFSSYGFTVNRFCETLKNYLYIPALYYFVLLGYASMFFGCSATSEINSKVKGFCLESPPMKVEQNQIREIANINVQWVAVIPYGYTSPGESLVRYDSEFQWRGERYEGAAELIQSAKAEGLKVMLKPQVWIPQMWVGDFYPKDLPAWEKSMTAFTLDFARLADSLDVELFCLATEYKKLTTAHPEFFEELIEKIRKVYDGEITYAANWDEYRSVTFWDRLDYIGVNAYFPLSDQEQPAKEELISSWNRISLHLSEASKTYRKPILFTEFGYRSIEKTTQKPWEQKKATYNSMAQSVAFEALFNSVWREPWMAGGFIWKWRFFDQAGGSGDASYTPQKKPAMAIIKEHFAK